MDKDFTDYDLETQVDILEDIIAKLETKSAIELQIQNSKEFPETIWSLRTLNEERIADQVLFWQQIYFDNFPDSGR